MSPEVEDTTPGQDDRQFPPVRPSVPSSVWKSWNREIQVLGNREIQILGSREIQMFGSRTIKNFETRKFRSLAPGTRKSRNLNSNKKHNLGINLYTPYIPPKRYRGVNYLIPTYLRKGTGGLIHRYLPTFEKMRGR